MRRFSRFLTVLLVVLAGLAPAAAQAESPPSAMGYWQGHIEYPGAPMLFNVTLLQNKAGEWAGVIGIPSQGVRDLRFNVLSVAGTSVSFGVKGINGDPIFTGEMSADGQAIHGTLSQMGQSFPFSLRRSTERPEDNSEALEPWEKDGVPGEGLAGRWLGLLEKEPARIRLVMEITQGADGSLEGTMVSPDQGGNAVPIDSIALDGKSVTMSLTSLYATYQAEMNQDGSMISGTWDQTGQTMTLDFKRQADSGK